MLYYSCLAAAINFRGGGGDNSENGQGRPVTLSLDKVTAATATFTGHLNVPASDISYSQVTIYYSDAETFNINSAESISTISFDEQQNFSITLTGLKTGVKYNYCMVTEVKAEKTFSDVFSFTTDNVTISELSVSPGCFKADMCGSITGLSEEDYEQAQIYICYTSNASILDANLTIWLVAADRVEVDDLSSGGEYSVSFSNLAADTKYYCKVIISLYGKTLLSSVAVEFTTLHPYDIPQDLNVTSATDLSSSGSANCYIVSSAGLYKFKTVKGNSNESVGSVASASILWKTFGTDTAPEFLDLISAFCYKDGYIAFQTAETFREGNAVIAAKDASGNILWSWHIWFTDEPEGQEYYNNAGTMMDRNLGATSATPGDVGALGLLYQWGRKDPFLGSSSISSSILANSTITWPSAVSSDSSNGTIAFATANPTTFIEYNDSNYDWYYTGSSSTDNTRWTTSESNKSIYDPCPAGWRVPDGGSYGIWSKALGSSSYIDYTYDSTNKGMNFSGKFGSASTIWYPASGYRSRSDGCLRTVGSYGSYWSASPRSSSACRLGFASDGGVDPSSSCNRAYGSSVRCLQE